MRERERERERESIYLPKTNERKKYNFIFDESANAWIINEEQTAWNFKKVEKERIYDITCMARHRNCYDNHDGRRHAFKGLFEIFETKRSAIV